MDAPSEALTASLALNAETRGPIADPVSRRPVDFGSDRCGAQALLDGGSIEDHCEIADAVGRQQVGATDSVQMNGRAAGGNGHSCILVPRALSPAPRRGMHTAAGWPLESARDPISTDSDLLERDVRRSGVEVREALIRRRVSRPLRIPLVRNRPLR